MLTETPAFDPTNLVFALRQRISFYFGLLGVGPVNGPLKKFPISVPGEWLALGRSLRAPHDLGDSIEDITIADVRALGRKLQKIAEE